MTCCIIVKPCDETQTENLLSFLQAHNQEITYYHNLPTRGVLDCPIANRIDWKIENYEKLITKILTVLDYERSEQTLKMAQL